MTPPSPWPHSILGIVRRFNGSDSAFSASIWRVDASQVPQDLSTPYLMVDVDVLERNLQRMTSSAQARGLARRPHVKTHKCLEIARRQVDLGAAGLTVATISEAEVFAAAGFEDLFIAYPVWASGRRARRLRALADEVFLR